MSDPIEPPDPDLDDIPAGELGEWDDMYATILDALEAWKAMRVGAHPLSHHVGSFLEELAAAGYRVTKIPPCPFPLLPEPTE